MLLSKPAINAEFSKSYPITYSVSYHPCFSLVWNPGCCWMHKLGSGINDMTRPRICSLNQRAHGGTFSHSSCSCFSLRGGILCSLTWRREIDWAWQWSALGLETVMQLSRLPTSYSSLGKPGSGGQLQFHPLYGKHKELPHILTKLNCWQAEQLLSD